MSKVTAPFPLTASPLPAAGKRLRLFLKGLEWAPGRGKKGLLFLLPLLFLCGATAGIPARTGQEQEAGACAGSLALLHDALRNGSTFFIQVHAAEALLSHGHPEGIGAQFKALRRASPANETGALRVLARLNRQHPSSFKDLTDRLRAQVLDTAARTRLVALESLGKLGYYAGMPQVRLYADTGTGGFKAMARWVLSNGGTAGGEDSLSALLLSRDPADYRYAAYALRFKSRVSAQSLRRLQQCLDRLGPDDVARVYVASSLFVHGAGQPKRQARAILLPYAGGDAGQRYEAAEALGAGGGPGDLPVLRRLAADPDMDVRVAAANATLKVMHCKG